MPWVYRLKGVARPLDFGRSAEWTPLNLRQPRASHASHPAHFLRQTLSRRLNVPYPIG